MNDKLVPKSSDKLITDTKPQTFGLAGLHGRIAASQKNSSAASEAMPNRIALMLDVSGSMHGSAGPGLRSKIEYLIEAMSSFINNCNFKDTSLAIETFPIRGHNYDDTSSTGRYPNRTPMTSLQPYLMTSVMSLTANGGTPMHRAMTYVIDNYSLTRGIIVSDGCADNPDLCRDIADRFAEAQVPVDCVYIGDETEGEALLQEIAQHTRGHFVKFTNVTSFARSFKFLTPALYGILSDGEAAKLLGAKEVK